MKGRSPYHNLAVVKQLTVLCDSLRLFQRATLTISVTFLSPPPDAKPDSVEEHGRPAVEIAIERSVRSAFNGSSRDTQWFPKSSEELQAGRDSLALSIASETAAGAGQNGTTEVEDTTNATVGARGAEAISDARALDGASELAAQWRTSLKEQERALQQCQARYCSAPSLTPGMRRAVGIPATDVACDPLTSLKAKTESEDLGLAALYGTSLQEQEQLLALSRF